MKRMKAFFVEQRLCYRMSRQYIALLLITMFVMSFLCSLIASNRTRHDNLVLSDVLLKQISDEFMSKIENMESLVNIIYFYESVCDTIEQKDINTSEYEQLMEAKEIYEVLKNLKYMQRDIDSIYLYSLMNDRYYGISGEEGFQFDVDANFFEEEKKKELLKKGGKIYIELAQEQSEASGMMFTAYKVIMGDDAATPVGIIKMDFYMEALANMKESIQKSNQGEFIILNQEGQTVYSTAEYENIDRMVKLAEENWEENNLLDVTLDGKKYFFNVYHVERLQWKIVFLIPQRMIEQNGKDIVNAICLVGIIAILISSLFVFKLTSRFTNPIIEITKHLKEIKRGNFIPIRLKYEYKDEIQDLIDGVNLMTERIDTLIKNEYEIQLQAKDAHFNMLVAQINPHFLYNVMENISGIGYSRKIPELSLITENLVDLLKYSINNKSIVVSIETELEYVTKYLEIQNYRFGDRIHLETDIQDVLLNSMILKFTIQPIVENAVVHGLAEKDYWGTIKISAQEQGENISIVVEDDGIGIDPELLAELNGGGNMEKIGESKKTHIGVRNVANRIKIYFGEEYGIIYRSIVGEGTQVIISIPKRLGR